MKFSGEIKFPEIDHPGVPIQFIIEGRQAEVMVEGESLGRWSLFDIHARRLVASAFQIDLEGTEVTFIADDPIDFAYRGVEHMAETWAQMKAMQVGRRMVAVRKSRKGTIPSRLDELRAAMEENLGVQTRPLAGELLRPAAQPPPLEQTEAVVAEAEEEMPIAAPEVAPQEAPLIEADARLTAERARMEEERRQLAAEWARLEDARRQAERQEEVRLEAYRLELRRLEGEREELRRQMEILTEEARAVSVPEPIAPEAAEPVAVEAVEEPEPVAVEEVEEPEPVAVEEVEEPEPVAVGRSVVDLNGLEEGSPPDDGSVPASKSPARQPAMAAAGRERGLMGAVKAAFARGGGREHEHQFIVAPGGIGIVRYVCEICGYVSISVND